MPFSAVAQLLSFARYLSAPLLHSPTPAVTDQVSSAASLMQQQQQFLNEPIMQFRMPLAQQQHTLQQATQNAQQQQQQQQYQHYKQQQMLSSLAQSILVSATSLDPRNRPTLGSTTPITATAAIHSSQLLGAHKNKAKLDKQKSSS